VQHINQGKNLIRAGFDSSRTSQIGLAHDGTQHQNGSRDEYFDHARKRASSTFFEEF
jgi:hypothetical protein